MSSSTFIKKGIVGDSILAKGVNEAERDPTEALRGCAAAGPEPGLVYIVSDVKHVVCEGDALVEECEITDEVNVIGANDVGLIIERRRVGRDVYFTRRIEQESLLH